MNKAIFLDRDGTINEDYGYVYRIEDFKFIDGVIDSLKELYDLGYLLIVISNQSGIGRGYYSKEDANKLFDYMVDILSDNGIIISKYYYCPHTDEETCECRKPRLQLFERAIKEFDIDTDNSFAIGDKIRDLSICKTTNVRGILINNKPVDSDFCCVNNLKEALEYIKEKN